MKGPVHVPVDPFIYPRTEGSGPVSRVCRFCGEKIRQIEPERYPNGHSWFSVFGAYRTCPTGQAYHSPMDLLIQAAQKAVNQ